MYIYKIKLEKNGDVKGMSKVGTSTQAWKAFDALDLKNESQEVLAMLTLDTNGNLTGVFEVSRGSSTNCSIDVKEVLKRALLVNAYAIILAHNHPSGNTAPSKLDKLETEKIARVCKDIGLVLADHLIIGLEEYEFFSFRENGLI